MKKYAAPPQTPIRCNTQNIKSFDHNQTQVTVTSCCIVTNNQWLIWTHGIKGAVCRILWELIMFSTVYNHLKPVLFYFGMSLFFYLQREWALFHRAMLHHCVSTVAWKGQPKHSLQRGPFAVLAANGVSLLCFVDARSTKSYALAL